ncbi:hypothetical protein H112_07807 [Trichophyton rubrum D6]|nr:hypothetical protein H110_07817 [Trichophyton rubrum MR1448]KDB29806.1 hypothetical protein H112_07807 [Trichophyton rubrum D6]
MPVIPVSEEDISRITSSKPGGEDTNSQKQSKDDKNANSTDKGQSHSGHQKQESQQGQK